MKRSFINTQTFLAIAAVAAPFTALRISFFGLAEIIFAVIFLVKFRLIVSNPINRRNYPLSTFWVIFLGLSLCGLAYSTFILADSIDLSVIGFDLAAYIFVLMAVLCMESLSQSAGFDKEKFLDELFFLAFFSYSSLYIISLFSDTIFGFPLKYYDNFVPLAENLHQVSMFLVPLPFLGLVIFSRSKGIKAVFILVSIALVVMMVIATGSAKARLGLIVGVLVYFFARMRSGLSRRDLLLVLILSAIVVIVAFVLSDGAHFFQEAFDEEDHGGARASLYGEAIGKIMESPLFGHGPGPHLLLNDVRTDAHQTFLTIFLQAGFVSVLAFAVLVIKVIRRSVNHPGLLAAASTLLIYAAGGDIMRRLPAWMILFLVLTYSSSPASLNRGAR